jgi:hypothetical protein
MLYRYVIVVGFLLMTTVLNAADKPSFVIPAPKERGKDELVINAAGDCAHPYQYFHHSLKKLKHKVHGRVKPLLDTGDLNFINLETPITTRKTVLRKRYTFKSPVDSLREVVRAGYNLYSLANNHMGDSGNGGIRDTINHLKRFNRKTRLYWAGTKPEFIFFTPPGKSITVAFAAFGNAYNIATYMKERTVKLTAAAAKKADLVIVSIHKGREYTHTPPSDLVKNYRRVIAAGADIILAHHPHVPQGIERYRDGIIFYSLGNYSLSSKTVRHRSRKSVYNNTPAYQKAALWRKMGRPYSYGRLWAKIFGLMPTIYCKGGTVRAVKITPLYVNNRESLVVIEGGKRRVLRPTPFVPQIASGVFGRHICRHLTYWSSRIRGNTTRFHIDKDVMWVRM